MASDIPVKLLLVAETGRDALLAQPAFAGAAAQIALGLPAPYRLADGQGLQLVLFRGLGARCGSPALQADPHLDSPPRGSQGGAAGAAPGGLR